MSNGVPSANGKKHVRVLETDPPFLSDFRHYRVIQMCSLHGQEGANYPDLTPLEKVQYDNSMIKDQ